MEIALSSRDRKTWFLAASLLVSATFIAASTLEFAADCLYRSAKGLPIAVRLVPGNAEYHKLLGHDLLEVQGDVQGARQQYQLASALNPHDSGNWLAVARAEQILGNGSSQRYALERAIEADPTTPDLAWIAGNFFLAQGDTGAALREFRVVVANEPGIAYAVFALCLRVTDVTTIIHRVLPANPAAYLTLIDFLTTRKKTADAVQVWTALTQLQRPVELRPAVAYIDYLISQHDLPDARPAWRQMAQICGLSALLGFGENLIVNPHFDSDILNGGFDWRYQRHANAEVALDPAEFHGGHRSLSIIFDGPGVDESGVMQYVPVQANTVYDFSAYYKAEAMDGAGGPRISIQDAYSGTDYFSSPDLRDAEVWHEMNGQFSTGADAQLVAIKIVRVPADSPIRGKLWVDDFRLVEKGTGL